MSDKILAQCSNKLSGTRLGHSVLRKRSRIPIHTENKPILTCVIYNLYYQTGKMPCNYYTSRF